MITRKSLTVPAAGAQELVEIAGAQLVVEKTPDNTPAGVPLIRIDSPGASPFPAFNQTHYRLPEGFHRFYVEGQGGTAGTIHLLIIAAGKSLQFRISTAVE